MTVSRKSLARFLSRLSHPPLRDIKTSLSIRGRAGQEGIGRVSVSGRTSRGQASTGGQARGGGLPLPLPVPPVLPDPLPAFRVGHGEAQQTTVRRGETQ
ncbi:hypothetical protein Pmani_012933 [Petrolisthes manimaculis]|uniref:Uncharacterized protein n=1 Tax=Petrolisthes manimaculis TaxID=1843537 RepID=A0AAE1PWY1_9EUCA|nr:hypothetical protein Pmani_012933 [Petrolisthes manimaculis]